jgi:hypothetical protein
MIPKIEYPTIMIDIKSLDRKVKFRPFLVKEEKILLIAKESGDADEIRAAVIQIINNCAQEPLEVEKLPLFDVEMIFLKIRAQSVGQSVKLVFNCQNEVDGVPCNTDTDYSVDLSKVKFDMPEGHTNKIMLSPNSGIKLKYPTLMNSILDSKDELDEIISMVVNNTEYLFDADSVTKPEELTAEQMMEFIDSLSIDHLEACRAFFNTTPRVILEDTVKCKKCGFEHKLETEGLLSFFI